MRASICWRMVSHVAGVLHIFWNSEDLDLMVFLVFFRPSIADDFLLVEMSWRISSIAAWNLRTCVCVCVCVDVVMVDVLEP